LLLSLLLPSHQAQHSVSMAVTAVEAEAFTVEAAEVASMAVVAGGFTVAALPMVGAGFMVVAAEDIGEAVPTAVRVPSVVARGL
jgi:hypothetical protein